MLLDLKGRTFLLGGTVADHGGSIGPARTGVIGQPRARTAVLKVFQSHADVKVGAICDVYGPNLEHAIAVAVKGGSQPKSYRNDTDLVADQDVQAVLIATPEHWHYQMVIDAIAAGKAIDVEKPLCRTPEEGAISWEVSGLRRTIRALECHGMRRRD